MIKIGVIGAGSIAWSSTLVRDLCLFPKLWGSTVVLMDKDENRLSLIYRFATRYASELNADLKQALVVRDEVPHVLRVPDCVGPDSRLHLLHKKAPALPLLTRES